MEDRLVIIDTNTGEVIPVSPEIIAELTGGKTTDIFSVQRKRGAAKSKSPATIKRVRMSRLDSGVFVNMIVSDGKAFLPDVQPTDMARLARLVTRLNWSGQLPTKSFDVDFIQKELDIKQTAAYQFVKFLKVTYGETLDDVECPMEDIFFKGTADNLKKDEDGCQRCVKLYVKGYAEAYKYNGKYDRSALGCLIKLAPFVNKNNGTLCRNVNMNKESRMCPLDTDEIAEIVGVEKKHFRERVISTWRKMLIPTNSEMKPIVANIGGLYVVNPALMAASKYDAGVWEYFLNGKIEEDE